MVERLGVGLEILFELLAGGRNSLCQATLKPNRYRYRYPPPLKNIRRGARRG